MIICFDLLKILAKEMIRSKKRGLEVRFNDRKSAAFRDSCVWRQAVLKGSEAS